MDLPTLLSHPQFRVLQRTGTRVWNAYFTNPNTGNSCFGAGDTPDVAMRMALAAATGTSPRDRCGVCGEPQDYTPSGPVCANGHGGVEPMDNEDLF